MLKKITLFFFILVIFLPKSLNAQNVLKGYTQLTNIYIKQKYYDVYYKIHDRKEKPEKIIKEDMVTFHIQTTNEKDSVLKSTYLDKPVTKFISEDEYTYVDESFLPTFLERLFVGDSATFALKAKDIYRAIKRPIPKFLNPEEYVKYHIKVLQRRSFKVVKRDEKQAVQDQRKIDEKKIAKYVAKYRDKKWKRTYYGIWYYFEGDTIEQFLRNKETQYLYAVENDVVQIDFVGKFLNGTVFNSSEKEGRAFEFPVGGKVAIKALDQVMPLMKVGMKGHFVIPSYLAYGAEGINDYMPPNSVVIFEIDFKKIIARQIVIKKNKDDADKELTEEEKEARDKKAKEEIQKMLEKRNKEAEEKLGLDKKR